MHTYIHAYIHTYTVHENHTNVRKNRMLVLGGAQNVHFNICFAKSAWMCVCVCVCMCVCVCVYVCVHVYVCMYACMYVCMYAWFVVVYCVCVLFSDFLIYLYEQSVSLMSACMRGLLPRQLQWNTGTYLCVVFIFVCVCVCVYVYVCVCIVCVCMRGWNKNEQFCFWKLQWSTIIHVRSDSHTHATNHTQHITLSVGVCFIVLFVSLR